MSILEATHREAVRSVVVDHGGIAAAEGEVARVSATNRTAPIVAVGTDTAERTIAASCGARHGQFKGEAIAPADCCCSNLNALRLTLARLGYGSHLDMGCLYHLRLAINYHFVGCANHIGVLEFIIKSPCAGWSVLLSVGLVAEVRHWWPSLNLPHWYKSP